MRLFAISIVVVALLASGCTEVNVIDKPAGPPVLEFVDIQPTNVIEFQDSILITFKYKDPDGDLGYEDPDVRSLSIHDLRLEKPDSQHVGLLAPLENHLDIEGELTVKLKNTFLLGSNDTEVTTYRLILTDRSGNQSNPIQTDEISIVREW